MGTHLWTRRRGRYKGYRSDVSHAARRWLMLLLPAASGERKRERDAFVAAAAADFCGLKGRWLKSQVKGTGGQGSATRCSSQRDV